MYYFNIMCPICYDDFQNTDEIFSTNCGHIFHKSCLNDWLKSSKICPSCQSFNPTTYKLYLNIVDSRGHPNIINELNEKLKTSNATIQKLHEKLVELNTKLQKQFAMSEKLMWELMERIKQTNRIKSNCLRLQIEQQKSGQYIAKLQENIQMSIMENTKISKDLKLKTIEISKLKSSLAKLESQITLNDKSNNVYQQFKTVNERKSKGNKDKSLKKSMLNSTEISGDHGPVLEVEFHSKMHEIQFLKFLNTL